LRRVFNYRQKVQTTQTNVVKEKGRILKALVDDERILGKYGAPESKMG
jgi:hypothetical protein